MQYPIHLYILHDLTFKPYFIFSIMLQIKRECIAIYYWIDATVFNYLKIPDCFIDCIAMEINLTLSVVIWFSTGTLGIFATLVYFFTIHVVIYDILSMAIIPTLSTSILLCDLCHILLWILPRSVVKIAIRI